MGAPRRCQRDAEYAFSLSAVSMTRLRLLALLASLGITFGYGMERMRVSVAVESDAADRGRRASSPFQMTWLGWRDVLARTIAETNNDRLLSVAGAIAFFTLLAIVPALSVLVSVYGLVAGTAFDANRLNDVFSILPASARDLLLEQAVRLATKPQEDLSFNLAISLGLAGWSANAATKGLFDGLNVIYDEDEKRSFIRLNFISLLVTLGGILLLITALFIIALAPAVVRAFPFSVAMEMLLVIARWPLFLAFGSLGIAVLFWVGPSRRPPRFIWVLPGAILAAFLWGAASAAFSWYVSKLGNYSATYGSLATVIVFMTWLWLSSAIVLFGAELNSELEHQIADDTTMGLPKPLGMRGAVVADHVGPAVAGRK